jgi:flagellar export protein FliJ
MKKFQFSLQRLLDLREFREKQAELALGKANAARDAIQMELEEVARKRVQAASERRGSLPIQDLVAIEHYVSRLDSRKERLLEDLASAELVVEQMREKYLAATRDRQVITKLKEKQQSAWRKDYLELESATLDDMTSSRLEKE